MPLSSKLLGYSGHYSGSERADDYMKTENGASTIKHTSHCFFMLIFVVLYDMYDMIYVTEVNMTTKAAFILTAQPGNPDGPGLCNDNRI